MNLAKTEFCHATVTFLGLLVGQGQVKPLEAKVNAISEFPVPKCKRQLMQFLGMAGYYRKFCKNFSGIAEPLTNLLKESTKFKWNDKCQDAFDHLKAILKSAPVLLAPDFDKCFKLTVDASVGAVLLQEDNNGIDHPVCYFSKSPTFFQSVRADPSFFSNPRINTEITKPTSDQNTPNVLARPRFRDILTKKI